MTPREIDEILARAAQRQAPGDEVDPAVLERVSAAILPGLRPVRPMPPGWVLVTGLVAVCFAVGMVGASIWGMYGLRKLSGAERALIFAVLALFAWLAAAQSAAEMVPGSQRSVNPLVLAPAATVVLIAIFAALFSGYAMQDFVQQGVPCLKAGLLHAVPGAGAAWLILRRGFAVNAVAAGSAAGTLAGLAGVIMLELHCANLRAVHVMVWHVAVIPVSAIAGALLARWADSRDGLFRGVESQRR